MRQIVSIMIAAGMLSLCLLASSRPPQSSRFAEPLLREVQAAFRDSSTQWMVFGCCAVYFATFLLLERRATSGRFWHWGQPQVWAVALLVLVSLHYVFDYESASGNTHALTLLGSAVLGKGVAVWAGWQNRRARLRAITAPLPPSLAGVAAEVTRRTRWGGNKFRLLTSAATVLWCITRNFFRKILTPAISPSDGARASLIAVLLVLLVVAVFLESDTGFQFQYRGQGRWTGPWDNPNIFGLLMGVGCVLALGLVIRDTSSDFATFSPSDAEKEIEADRKGTKIPEIWRWIRIVMFVAAGVICGIGLIKSYSRGAWLGVAVAMGYFGWGWWTAKTHRTPALNIRHLIRPSATFSPSDAEKGTSGGEGEALSREARLIPVLRRNLVPLLVILLSVVILAFWNFRHTERAAARRAFSVANVNDFSWRNRVAAWEGALQMMAGKPFLGFGWNEPERVYDQFYRVPKVTESAAWQMNDYFTLGTTLGIPAMVCFLIYVGLSLTWNGERKDRPSSQPSPQRGEGENQAPVRRETDSLHEALGSRRREEAERAANPVSPPRHLGACNTESNLGMSVTGWQRCPTTDWLRTTCRAGAIVLLVGFWFDGGLFKLATGSVFWILLELGRSERVEPLESESVKASDTL